MAPGELLQLPLGLVEFGEAVRADGAPERGVLGVHGVAVALDDGVEVRRGLGVLGVEEERHAEPVLGGGPQLVLRPEAQDVGVVALGVGEGFENGMERVSDQMQRSLDEAAPDSNIIPFNRSLDAPAVSGGSVTSFGGVTLIVNGYNVQDDEALAERLSYELQKISDQRGA